MRKGIMSLEEAVEPIAKSLDAFDLDGTLADLAEVF